jgi:hypothetical protein
MNSIDSTHTNPEPGHERRPYEPIASPHERPPEPKRQEDPPREHAPAPPPRR